MDAVNESIHQAGHVSCQILSTRLFFKLLLEASLSFCARFDLLEDSGNIRSQRSRIGSQQLIWIFVISGDIRL